MSDVVVKKGEHFVETGGEFEPIGCLDLPLSEGTFHIHDGDLAMVTELEHAGNVSVGVIVCATDAPARSVRGLLNQLSPNEARSFAASLIGIANEIDGGMGMS